MSKNFIQVELQAVYGDSRCVAESAWTSSLDYQKKESRTDEDVKRVVNMLADAKHSTPFESIIFRWWIRMPVAIDRQFMTHRLQSASGQSARYRTMPTDFLPTSNDVLEILQKAYGYDKGLNVALQYETHCVEANNFYQQTCRVLKESQATGAISNPELKRAREFLRGVLPQHNFVERVSVMNLRSWCNFYRLRSKSDAQPEIQQIAYLMLQEIKKHDKILDTVEALEKNDWRI
jgi:thymidylate synthase (FAD)